MDSKINDLRKKYQTQADAMSTKPRFGYFSILPSHTAAKTDYKKTQCRKDTDGRVKVQNKNIFSGITTSGVLKKNYFSVPKSIYQGDPYINDYQRDRKRKNNQQKNGKQNVSFKQQKKEVFVPAKLNKTLSTPAYPYTCQISQQKKPKRNRNQDGSVKTKLRNICTNSASKITQEKLKYFKYSSDAYQNQHKLKNDQLKKSIMKRKDGPFISGSHAKDYFRNNITTFNDHEIKKIVKKPRVSAKVNHECAFRPSCYSSNKLFSALKTQGDTKQLQDKQNSLSVSSSTNNQRLKISASQKLFDKQPFKFSNLATLSKPSPSIAYHKFNLVKHFR